MQESPLGEPKVHVDVCRQGDGIWFDGGELQQLLKQAAVDSQAEKGVMKQITAFLGETFKAGQPDNSGA
jgi:Zn-finger nucleic acid-binding protein